MNQDDFIKHGCEQVLRFSKVENWDDLPPERKVQLGFNMGVISLGLGLSKDDGFMALSDVVSGKISMDVFRDHLLNVIQQHQISIDEDLVVRPF